MKSPDTTSSFRLKTAFVTLAGENLQTLVQFYQNLLGQAPEAYTPQHYAEFSLPGVRLALFKPSSEHGPKFSGPAASMSLCLEVDNLAAAIISLTNLGYPPPESIINTRHGDEIYAYDPAGNRLILHQAPS